MESVSSSSASSVAYTDLHLFIGGNVSDRHPLLTALSIFKTLQTSLALASAHQKPSGIYIPGAPKAFLMDFGHTPYSESWMLARICQLHPRPHGGRHFGPGGHYSHGNHPLLRQDNRIKSRMV